MPSHSEDRIAGTEYGAVVAYWEPDGVGAYMRWGDRLLPGQSLAAAVKRMGRRYDRQRRREAQYAPVRA